MFFILPGGRNGFNLLIHFLATKTRHETSGLKLSSSPGDFKHVGFRSESKAQRPSLPGPTLL